MRLFYRLKHTVKSHQAIKLNGRDLGIVWCAPWRVEVPGGLLKTQGNQLEITVANLWINRLIGDAALPEAKRLTWTTRNPYKPDSPLQASGLLGPVSLLMEDRDRKPLPFQQEGQNVTVPLPSNAPDALGSVLCLDIANSE